MITNFEWIQIFIAIIMAYILGIGMGIRFESKKDSSRQTAISRNHSQGTKTFYTEQDESSSSDERTPVSEEDGKSDPFFEGQKPDTKIKQEEKKDE